MSAPPRRRSLAIAAAALAVGAAVTPAAASGAATAPAGSASTRTAVPATRTPVPQGTTYWRIGSRVWVLLRAGQRYRFAQTGSGYSCEFGTFSGVRTNYRWAERVAGRAESGTGSGRMWLAGGKLQYRNSALNNFAARPAKATPGLGGAATKALAKCSTVIG